MQVAQKAQEFNIGDYLMVQIRPERYPPSTVKKMYARSAGLFRILKKK